VAHQDQARAVLRVFRHRVGVEHHREAVAVGDACEDRDYLGVAFQRVDVDRMSAVRQRRQAGVADEILDAGFGEHIWQLLFGHPQRLYPEERVEQPPDLGLVGGDVIAVAGQRLQLFFLAAQPPAHRIADQCRRLGAGRHRHQRAVVDGSLMRQHCHRILKLAPAQRLLVQRQHVGGGLRADRRDQRVEIGAGGVAGEFAVPQRHVEGGMLAAHEARCAHAVFVPQRQRQQQQRPAFAVAGDDNEGRKVFAHARLRLPGAEEIEPLIAGGEMPGAFERAPDRFGRTEVTDDIDAGDAPGFRPRRRFGRPAFGRGRHGHLNARKKGKYLQVRLRPTFAKKCQQRVMTMRSARAGDSAHREAGALPADIGFVTRARLQLAYFSGYALIRQRDAGGAGIVLRFQRVRPRRGDRFQPLKSAEITPQFLDRTIAALKRWKYDIVSLDEACRRAVTLAQPRRFVCLTFDGAYKDLMTSAYPVLSRHRVPFAVYVPTAFPDGVGEAWWLALEAVIARENRISLVIDRKELHFNVADAEEKYQLHHYLDSWMRTLAPGDLSAAINDLCKRYSVDLSALSRQASLDWDDLATLAADPLVTIGS